MKKIVIALAIVFIIVFSFICGYYIYKESGTQQEFSEAKIEMKENSNKIEISNLQENIIETSSQEDKISPNAVLTIEKYYKGCGHTIEDEAEIPEEAVNKTKQELQEIYSTWTIKEFSPSKVTLYKELDGICNEHYLLKKVDNVVAVFTIDENGEEKLHERTGISTQYLTQEDIKKLEKGIKAIGRVQLNSILEDYE